MHLRSQVSLEDPFGSHLGSSSTTRSVGNTHGHSGNPQTAPTGRRVGSHLLFAECQMGPDGSAIFPGSYGGKTLPLRPQPFSKFHPSSASARLSLPFQQMLFAHRTGRSTFLGASLPSVGWEHLPSLCHLPQVSFTWCQGQGCETMRHREHCQQRGWGRSL